MNFFGTMTKFYENKKYVLSNSESVQCNFFIFDYITFIQFNAGGGRLRSGRFMPVGVNAGKGKCRGGSKCRVGLILGC